MMIARANQRVCPVCGSRFDPGTVKAGRFYTFCSERCSSIKQLRLWKGSTDPEYLRRIDFSLIPNPAAFRAALKQFAATCENLSSKSDEAKGLWIFGPTGSGKTRLMHAMRKRVVLSRHGEEWLSGNDFNSAIIRRLGFSRDEDEPGISSLETYLDTLKQCDFLFMDDVAKLRLSDRVAVEFHALLDYRVRKWSPIIFSSVWSPAETFRMCFGKNDRSGRLVDDPRAAELVRRIVEHCEPIKL